MIFRNISSNFLQLGHADNTVDKTVDDTSVEKLILCASPYSKIKILMEPQ